jgi:hypothetical protein
MPDVGQIYGQAQNIQMNRMRMAEAQETAQERNALRGLMAAGVDLNTPEGLNQLRRAAPMLAPQFEQAASQRAYQTAQTARLRAQTDADRFKLYRGQLGGVNDQAAWDDWRGRVVQEFPQFAGSIPQRFSPQARLDVAGGAELLIQRATAGAERAPVSVAAGSSLVDPRTGRVIYTAPARPQDQAPISVAPGNSVIDRAGNVIYTAPPRAQDQAPISVAPGNSVIDRSGNVLFTAPERAPSPVSVAPGGTLVNPRTGEPVFTSPDRPPSPVSVAPGGTLVNPRTGEPVFTSPDRPRAPSARDERIADIMTTFRVDRPTAMGIVDGIERFDADPVTGQPRVSNMFTNQSRPLNMMTAPAVPAAPAAPAAAGAEAPPRTLYALAQVPRTTGALPAVGEAAQRVAGQVGINLVSPEFTNRRLAFETAKNEALRAWALNDRFPVAEMQRILREYDITPGAFTDPQTLQTRIHGMSTALRTRLANEERASDDTNLPITERRSARVAANNIRNFLSVVGAPEAPLSPEAADRTPVRRGTPARLPAENSGEVRTPSGFIIRPIQ